MPIFEAFQNNAFQADAFQMIAATADTYAQQEACFTTKGETATATSSPSGLVVRTDMNKERIHVQG